MMSTLVLAMVAGLAFGNSPGPVSAEAEQGLDMRGEWEGIWRHNPSLGASAHMPVVHAYFKDDAIHVGGRAKGVPFRIVDEGGGKCRVTVVGEPRPAVWHGIYRYEGNRLLLCWGLRGVRPLTLEPGRGEILLTLRRVKPGK
jgi:hypothetical protein